MTDMAMRRTVALIAAVVLLTGGCVLLPGSDGFSPRVVNRGPVDRLVVFQGQGMKDETSNRQTWLAKADGTSRQGPFIQLDPAPRGEIRVYTLACVLLTSFPIRDFGGYDVTITNDGPAIARTDVSVGSMPVMPPSSTSCE